MVGGGNFCDKCGARLAQAGGAAPAPPAQPPIQPSVQPPRPPAPVSNLPAVQPASQGSSVLVKVLVGFLIFILLIVLAVMGSCVYIGYRAKKKADEIQQAYKSNDLSKLAGALGVGSQSGFEFLAWKFRFWQWWVIQFGPAFFSRLDTFFRK